VVALDISGAVPKLKWYYKVSPNDVHDNDPAMPPVLFSGKVGGVTRKLLAVGDKAGDFVILDRTTGKLVSRLVVSDQRGIFNSVPTVSGTIACPSHGGGIEWNGGSYDASTDYFIVPSTQECAVWKIIYTGKVPYIPGQPYSAGPLPPRSAATGVVSAIDVSTGKVAWRKALPYSVLTGAAFARSGLNVTQIYGVVSKQMPLTAPGSLSATDYAALMAYILAYACVQPAAGGKPFPAAPPPQFSNVQLGPTSCPPE
jgi:alcohol dehydrogenase (cytochrome c)